MKRTGVQIGEKEIRVVIEQKQRGKWRVIFHESEPLPEGCVKNGQVVEPDKLGLAIKEFFLKKNIRETHVAVFVEEIPFFIRHIDLPKMYKKELASAIQFRAQMEFPVNPEDLIIRYYPLEKRQRKKIKRDEVQGEYILIAMDKSMVKSIVEAIHHAGLTLSSLTIEPISIYHGILRNEELKKQLQENVLIIRTDTSRMMLAIFSKGKLVYSRYLPFSTGKQDWEQEISRTLISWNSIERHASIDQIIVYGQQEHEEKVRKHIEEILMSISLLHISDPYLPCRGLFEKKEAVFYVDRVAFKLLKKTPLYVYALVLITGFMFFSLLYQYGSQAYLRTSIVRLQGNINENGKIVKLLEKQSELTKIKTSVLKSEREVLAQHTDPIQIYNLIAPSTPGMVTFTQINFDHESIKLTGRTGDTGSLIQYYLFLQQNANLKEVTMNNAAGGRGGIEFSFEMKRKGIQNK